MSSSLRKIIKKRCVAAASLRDGDGFPEKYKRFTIFLFTLVFFLIERIFLADNRIQDISVSERFGKLDKQYGFYTPHAVIQPKIS